MKLRLVRHATLVLDLAGTRLLIDPMLAPAGSYPSLTLGGARNPTAALPCDPSELAPKGLLITHAHFDHWDARARQQLSRALPLLCPEEDAGRFRRQGFRNVFPVGALGYEWRGIQLAVTGGRHGTGLIGQAMGKVAGFVLRAPQEPTLYLAGDTVWCPEVEDALARHRPDVVVVNAGAARFDLGGPITMDAGMVARVAAAAPEATVVAVHMEAMNHCRLSRRELASHLASGGLEQRVRIPADGEILDLPARPAALRPVEALSTR